MFDECKRQIRGTSKCDARKSRKRVDHQKEADFDPHQQLTLTGREPICEQTRAQA